MMSHGIVSNKSSRNNSNQENNSLSNGNFICVYICGKPPPPYNHQSQVWHPSKWTGPLDQLCTNLDGDNLSAIDQVVRVMI